MIIVVCITSRILRYVLVVVILRLEAVKMCETCGLKGHKLNEKRIRESEHEDIESDILGTHEKKRIVADRIHVPENYKLHLKR